MKENKIKAAVRARYSQMVEQSEPSCGCGVSPRLKAETVGYSREDLACVPQEALMGLGCGNPIALADVKPGETVLDLGSGAGIDAFLAAHQVGPEGKVIGIDMTQEMINKASAIARESGYQNVEFRLGEIEQLPVDDGSVDIIISNCVINLAPDKSKVYREAYRALRPGGRLVVSDIVAERPLSSKMKENIEAWTGCIAGALEQGEYLDKIRQAGFGDLQIISSREFRKEGLDQNEVGRLLSITVRAYKHKR